MTTTAHRSCGTQSGYVRHARLKEDACRPCKDAHAAYNRGRYRALYGPPHFPAASYDACGTTYGYQRHRRRREDVCAECRAARLEYQRAWRAKRKAELAPAKAVA